MKIVVLNNMIHGMGQDVAAALRDAGETGVTPVPYPTALLTRPAADTWHVLDVTSRLYDRLLSGGSLFLDRYEVWAGVFGDAVADLRDE